MSRIVDLNWVASDTPGSGSSGDTLGTTNSKNEVTAVGGASLTFDHDGNTLTDENGQTEQPAAKVARSVLASFGRCLRYRNSPVFQPILLRFDASASAKIRGAAARGTVATDCGTFDAWNRPVVVKNAGNSTLASYFYDADGRRIIDSGPQAIHLYYNTAGQVLEDHEGVCTIRAHKEHTKGSGVFDVHSSSVMMGGCHDVCEMLPGGMSITS